ncbi:lactosylceramide 4-alpha-galactosyltransferase-like [Cloeon dipterum]|uniref:lactosylceramide 4-alpha-galactosyltransferase-like n=1 Tax=Cloeon dipterum TaxID=197152 RepID=UPI00321F7343
MEKDASRPKIFITILLFVSFHLIFFSYHLSSSLPLWLSSRTKYFCEDTVTASKMIHLEDAIEVLDKRDQSRRAYYMIDSSRQGVVYGRQACAVESLAKNNPDADVYLLVLYPPRDLRVQTNEQLDMVKRRYPNIQMLSVKMEKLIEGSILEEWYARGELNKSSYPVEHTSDLIRVLVVQRYGGTYLDLDFIVLRSLADLSENFVSYQMSSDVNNAMFGFSKNHLITRMILQRARDKYEPWAFATIGPLSLIHALEIYCGCNVTEMVKNDTCNDLRVYPSGYFYPVAYTVWWVLFENSTSERLASFNESYAIHFSNFMSKNEIVRVGSDQVYSVLAKQHCPRAYWSSYDVF